MSTIRTALTLTALSLALAVAAGAQVLDPYWEGPVELSSYEGHVLDRAIASDNKGRAVACWIEERLYERRPRSSAAATTPSGRRPSRSTTLTPSSLARSSNSTSRSTSPTRCKWSTPAQSSRFITAA
ncbi:MAG: hypothetical protein R2724_09655 [Bryobacterales bacterium]